MYSISSTSSLLRLGQWSFYNQVQEIGLLNLILQSRETEVERPDLTAIRSAHWQGKGKRQGDTTFVDSARTESQGEREKQRDTRFVYRAVVSGAVRENGKVIHGSSIPRELSSKVTREKGRVMHGSSIAL